MKDLISVIVPVYNVEKYLNRCVDSILAQTYKNLEVILVDDGSPDNCPAICDEYAKQDKRVKVIHKMNGGLSDARNAGLDVAKGDFIAFVDSDDWIDCTMYEKMLAKQKEDDADLVLCNFKKVDQEDNVIEITDLKEDAYNDGNKFDLLFKLKINVAVVVSWNKLYKKHIFENLRFPYGKINEDEFVIYDILDNSAKVAILKDALYYYFVRTDSIMNQKKPSEKMLNVIDAMKNRLEKTHNTKYEKDAINQYLYNFVYCYGKVYKNKNLRKEVFKQFKNEYKLSKKLKFKDKVKYFLFRLLPNIVYYLKLRKM